jgi:hypothetical protein
MVFSSSPVKNRDLMHEIEEDTLVAELQGQELQVLVPE